MKHFFLSLDQFLNAAAVEKTDDHLKKTKTQIKSIDYQKNFNENRKIRTYFAFFDQFTKQRDTV